MSSKAKSPGADEHRATVPRYHHHPTVTLFWVLLQLCCHGLIIHPVVSLVGDSRIQIKPGRQQNSWTEWRISVDNSNNNQGSVPSKQHFHSRRKPQRRGHGRNPRSLETYEDEQRSHLEWMVRTTANILGENAPPPGEMPPYMIGITYTLMQAWVQRAGAVQSSQAPHVIERLLQRLLQEKNAVHNAKKNTENEDDNNNEDNHDDNGGNGDGIMYDFHEVEIHTGVYNTVLEGWSNSREKGSAERAEEILLQMELIHGLQPTNRSYNAVLKAYVKNGDRKIAANKAITLIEKMEATQSPNAMPNRRSYNLLLYALANAPSTVVDNAAERAQEILERMLARYHAEGEDCPAKPDINSFNQVIGAWVRGKSPNFEVKMTEAYKLLLEWSNELEIEPNVDTFNAIMGGWLKSNDRNSLSRIQEIFNDMEKSFEGGNLSARPNRASINTLQVALNRHRRYAVDTAETLLSLEMKYDLRPNRLSKNILLDSIIKSGAEDAPERAMEILTKMEDDFKNGCEEMKPDSCSYSSVILAYTTYGRDDLAETTEHILARMWDLHHRHKGNAPDVELYNSVVNSFASLESSQALERVKRILHEMENGESEGIPRPNLVTYNTVIKAMRSGNDEEGAVFAESILTTLESFGKRDPKLLPDNYSYTSVINAYARSNSPRKAEKSLEIVNRMMEAYENGNTGACVTIFTLNSALNACAFVDGSVDDKARAYEVAMKLDALKKKLHLKPDNTWFGTMLRACSSLLPPSPKREELVDGFFGEACEEGCVGRLVLSQLKFAANAEQYERLVDCSPDDKIHPRDLPKEWTFNGRDTRPFYKNFSKASNQL